MARKTTEDNGAETVVAEEGSVGAAVVAQEPAGSAVVVADEDFSQYAGAGSELATAKSMLLPRIAILESLSPQVQENKQEYIAGAKVGMICDVGLGQFWQNILFIPCFFADTHLEWAPINSGRGLVKNHGTDPSIMSLVKRDDKGNNMLENGNHIVETAEFYGLNVIITKHGEVVNVRGRPSFLPMASTRRRVARHWVTMMKEERLFRGDGTEFNPPTWYHAWKLSTIGMQKGTQSWFTWRVEMDMVITDLDPSKQLLKEAIALYTQAKEGLVRGDLSKMDAETDGARGSGDDEAM